MRTGKNLLVGVLCMVVFLGFSFSARAQDESPSVIVTTNPVTLAFGMFNASVEMPWIGKNWDYLDPVINVAYCSYSYDEWETSAYALSAGVKKFFSGQPKGVYLGLNLGWLHLSSDYNYSADWYTETGSGSANAFYASTMLGYRWLISNRLAIGLEAGAVHVTGGEVKAKTEVKYQYGGISYKEESTGKFNGFIPMAGLTIGFAF